LTGDLLSPAGARTTTVIGIQTVPVVYGPTDQQTLVYQADIGKWVPTTPANVTDRLNGEPSLGLIGVDMSEDFDYSVNGIGLNALVDWAYGFDFFVFINGVGVEGSET
jgi:hypothetical protein